MEDQDFYQKTNVIHPKDHEDFCLHFHRAHYLRPDKKDRDYEHHKYLDQWPILPEDIADCPKIIEMTICYDSKMVLTMIIEFDSNIEDEESLDTFKDALMAMEYPPSYKLWGMENPPEDWKTYVSYKLWGVENIHIIYQEQY